MTTPSVELHYPDRAAPQLLAGVLYQLVWTANRWLSLADDEVLVVEGDEDLVVATIRDGQVVALEQEQIKRLSRKITARAPAAYETFFAFLCSFHTLSLEKKQCRFVFTTNAALGAQQVDLHHTTTDALDPSRLCIDLLKTWRSLETLAPDQIVMLTTAVKALVSAYCNHTFPPRAANAKGPKSSIDALRVQRALEFLDEAPERWATFLHAVEIRVDAGDTRKVFEELKGSLARDPRTLHVDSTAVAYRLVFEVMQSGAEPDVRARHLSRSSLDDLVQSEQKELLDWRRSAHPERVWQLDVVNDLRRRVEQLEGRRVSGIASEELRARHLAAVRAHNAQQRLSRAWHRPRHRH